VLIASKFFFAFKKVPETTKKKFINVKNFMRNEEKFLKNEEK